MYTPRTALLALFSVCLNAQHLDLLREAARLDSEQKCAEAEKVYQQALAWGPASVALLNNLGNHYVLCGDREKARTSFERVLASNPQHRNARLQLARIATQEHQGARAVKYLSALSLSTVEEHLLHAEALHWAGNNQECRRILHGLRPELGGQDRLLLLYGITCGRIGEYERAEETFQELLTRHPDDFDLLFQLGRAAARSGQYARAKSALEVALRLRPQDVDTMLELGAVSVTEHDYERAVYVLAKARKIAPGRPEVILNLARAALAGNYYADAAIAYGDYLRIKPADDEALRDHAFALGFTSGREQEGIRKLTEYTAKHPEDATGHFEMAQLTWRSRPEDALAQLADAVRLDPSFAPAHVNRAWLLSRMGRAEEALPHLQRAISQNPNDVRALDQLGVSYQSLDRLGEAERVLRRAFATAPADPDVLLHLGRVLMESGMTEEGQRILAQFQKAGSTRRRAGWTTAGIIESATLPTAERTQRDINRLRRDAGTHPDDPELQFRLAGLLLLSDKPDEARSEFETLLKRNPGPRLNAEAGKLLLNFGQSALAKEFLTKAAADVPAMNVELATATLAIDGPQPALAVLDRVPEAERGGAWLLTRAKLLDAAGRVEESERILNGSMAAVSSDSGIMRDSALLLARHGRRAAALKLLSDTREDNPDLTLLKATLLALDQRNNEAEALLREIELQRPEWSRVYMVHGLVLEKRRPQEAVQKIRVAKALGETDRAADCALSRLTGDQSDGRCSCVSGLEDFVLPRCLQ